MANRTPRGWCGNGGFSLAELMVAVSILAVIALLVALDTGAVAARERRAGETRRLLKRLDYFRQIAVFRGRPVCVEFDAVRGTYRAREQMATGRPDALSDWERPGEMRLVSFDGVSAGEMIDPPRVVFAPDGVSQRHVLEFRSGQAGFRVQVGALRTSMTWSQGQ